MGMGFHELAGLALVWRDDTVHLSVPHATHGEGGWEEKHHFSTEPYHCPRKQMGKIHLCSASVLVVQGISLAMERPSFPVPAMSVRPWFFFFFLPALPNFPMLRLAISHCQLSFQKALTSPKGLIYHGYQLNNKSISFIQNYSSNFFFQLYPKLLKICCTHVLHCLYKVCFISSVSVFENEKYFFFSQQAKQVGKFFF